MKTAAVATLLAVLLPGGEKPKEPEGKKPGLELRHRPLFPRSPADMSFTAELKGGVDSEDYYCPTVEWEWGDHRRHGGEGGGAKSVEESDCEPYQAGVTPIVRHFEKEHRYPEWGSFRVQVTLRKGSRVIARQTKVVVVKAGAGDPTALGEPE